MSYVIVNGQKVPVEQFEGSSVEEERQAHAKNNVHRRLERQRSGTDSMMSGSQFLQGDPRKARKNFRFSP